MGNCGARVIGGNLAELNVAYCQANCSRSLWYLTGVSRGSFESISDMSKSKLIGVITFDGFETLDVYGPLGLLVSAALGDLYTAVLIGPPHPKSPGTLATSSKLSTITPHTLQWPVIEKYDILLIPGGLGNRPLLKDQEFLDLLKKNVETVLADRGTILCVCTGSVLLAATGLLNGKAATTNKYAYNTLTPQYPAVLWKREARWVVDGQIITSSGITAGMVHLFMVVLITGCGFVSDADATWRRESC
jgi:putative intracellular protease/amidase